MDLLILKCSSRKRDAAAPMPAIERYDGPMWQVLRSYLREHPGAIGGLDVFGLSAEFGLFPASEQIPWYERTMDPDRAHELQPQVMECFQSLMARGYERLCLGVSKRYLRALAGWEQAVPDSLHVMITDGPAGVKLGQLRAWLHRAAWGAGASAQGRIAAPASPRGKARIGGVTIEMMQDEALRRARLALAADAAGASAYRDWYVCIDGRRVSTKWLVSRLTGLPTTEFEASRARQVLLALGFDIERVTPA